MYKLKKKVKFSHSENLMRQEGDVKSSLIDIEKIITSKHYYMKDLIG